MDTLDLKQATPQGYAGATLDAAWHGQDHAKSEDRADLAESSDNTTMLGTEAGADPPTHRSTGQQRLGRYLVRGVLGRGGMGVVLDAYDEALERPVALKQLNTDLALGHALRLEREAKALAKLSHPNVVHVYEVGHVDGKMFIAMELVLGQTLMAWQQEPHDWRECVNVYLQAGRGLAAAHAKGLIHRDFKPGNCIIDQAGRVRVLDFGLVRELNGPPLKDRDVQEDRDDQADPVASPTNDLLMTQPGAVLGTLAYMPREQLSGEPADARSDQFSFCVALYEALYGERPFASNSVGELTVALVEGTVQPPPKDSQVPASLRRILLRGLSSEPDARWPSMDALLDELAQRVQPRQIQWAPLAIAGGLMGMVVFAVLWQQQQAPATQRCQGAREHLQGVWDDQRKQQVKDAILGTGLSYAEGTWRWMEPWLDGYSEGWVAKHTEVCEATAVRQEQSSEVMDLRMECLEDRRRHLRAAVQVLGEADAAVVEKAVNVVTSLPGLTRCDEIDALRAKVPPSEDPTIAKQVEALREQLTTTEAVKHAGRYTQALHQVQAVVEQAEALQYMPLVAEAKLERGQLHKETGAYEQAEHDLKRAYLLALEHEHDKVEFWAATWLANVVGEQQQRHELGMQWGETALAVAKRHGDNDQLATSLENLGAVFSLQGKYEQAEGYHTQALRIREQALDPDHPDAASSLEHFGIVLYRLGKYEQAKLHHARALRIREKTLGPDHPWVASSLSNLGSVFSYQGKYAQAEEHTLKALKIAERALGPDHPVVASMLNNLADVFARQGKLDKVELYHTRALQIRERTLGPEHPNVAASLNNLGALFARQGEYNKAEPYYRRALQARERVLDPEHPDLASSLHNLGEVFFHQGKYEQAKLNHTRALQIWERALGPNHIHVASSLLNLGALFSRQGQLKQAKAHYTRALQIMEKTLGPDHPDVGYSLNNLGLVLFGQGEVVQAKLHMERALKLMDKTLGPNHPRVATPLLGLAQIALAQHQFDAARIYAERAVSIRTSNNAAPELLAKAHFLLAKSLWGMGRDKAHARDLAELAREALAKADKDKHREGQHRGGQHRGNHQQDQLAEVEQWLKTHRVR